MTNIKKIRTYTRSVEQTLEIVNTVYLISSSNLRRTHRQLADMEPYFSRIEATISDILHHSPEINHRFFDKRSGTPLNKRETDFTIATGGRGLTGTCNHSILKLAEEKMSRIANPNLLVVRQVGRSYFLKHDILIDVEFLYTAQDPNTGRTRDMAGLIPSLYPDSQLDEVYVLFTKMVSSFQVGPAVHRLLPLDPDVFPEYKKNQDSYNQNVVYVSSVKAVMDRLILGYVKGDLFGTLVGSYCPEQNAYMTAMKSSSDNVRAVLQRLSLSFNRAHQAAITQEVMEAVDGAQVVL